MKIEAHPLYEGGKLFGTRFLGCDEEGVDESFSILRYSDGKVEIALPADTEEVASVLPAGRRRVQARLLDGGRGSPACRGQWIVSFTTFQSIARPLASWLDSRASLGTRLVFPLVGPHTRVLYYAPGATRAGANAPPAGVVREDTTFFNALGHPVARVARHGRLSWLLMGEHVGLFRGRDLTAEELVALCETNVTVELNIEAPPDYLRLDSWQASVVVETASALRRLDRRPRRRGRPK